MQGKNNEKTILMMVIGLFVFVLTCTFVLSYIYFQKRDTNTLRINDVKQTYNKPIALDSLAQLLQIFNNDEGYILITHETQTEQIKCYYQSGNIVAYEKNDIIYLYQDKLFHIIDHSQKIVVEVKEDDIINFNQLKEELIQINEDALLEELSTTYSTKPHSFEFFGNGIYEYINPINDKLINIYIQQSSLPNSFSLEYTSQNMSNQIKTNNNLIINNEKWDIDWEKITQEYTVTNSNSIINEYINE